MSQVLQIARPTVDDDRRWLAVMAAVTILELGWWATAWSHGLAPSPFVAGYVILASAGLASAISLRLALRLTPACSNWPGAILGTILTAIGASAFLPP